MKLYQICLVIVDLVRQVHSPLIIKKTPLVLNFCTSFRYFVDTIVKQGNYLDKEGRLSRAFRFK